MPSAGRRRTVYLLLVVSVVVAVSLALLLARTLGRDASGRAVVIKASHVYDPTGGDDPGNVICQAVRQEHPDVQIVAWSPLRLTAYRGNSRLLLAFAGRTGPDIFYNHFHEIRKNVDQGFCTPLNEYIGDDTNGNGQIDPEEAKWDYWKEIPEITRFAATVNGKVYGIPWSTPIFHGLVYRRDLFRKAGLPDIPPKDWDEFWYYCQKLTDPGRQIPGARFARGQRGFALPLSGWQWLQWLWAAGGEALMQGKTNPVTGKTHWFKEEETRFLDPETGDDLSRYPSAWRATLADEAGTRACRFYHKLCWQKWIRNPRTGEPIDLSDADLAAGSVRDPRTGEVVAFSPDKVITGAMRTALGGEASWPEMFRLGEVAMVMSDVRQLEMYNVSPENLGFFPVPGADASHHSVVGFFNHYLSLGPELIDDRRKEARDVAWEIISRYAGPEGQLLRVRRKAEQGYARFMTPTELEAAGLSEYIDQIPKHWRDNFRTVIAHYHVEPFMGYWYPIDAAMMQKVLGILARDETFDYAAALKDVEDGANSGIMFGLPEKTMRRARPWAYAGVATGAVFFIIAMIVVIRYYLPQEGRPSVRGVHSRLLPWLMLAPAILLILLWAYYPLARGAVMAFQDYRIVGESSWVGVDNFINVFLNRDFYTYCAKTAKYVALALSLTFLTPIFLALLLSEVPRNKTFWRTIYFLPQISSGLVILFIWKLLYNPTEYGLLNQVLLTLNRLPPSVVIGLKGLLTLLVLGAAAVLLRVGFRREDDFGLRSLLLTGVSLFLSALILSAVINAFLPPITRLVSFSAMFAFLVLLKFALSVRRGSPLALVLRGLSALLLLSLVAWAVFSALHHGGAFDALRSAAGWFAAPFTFEKQDWLGSARWAMIAVILPGMWSGAGMGSLIYLAALKSVDEESYEAAEIDGAGIWHKIWNITLPYLKPLIIINFIGAFIGTFQTMENIFAMTGGGPGDETMVLSLAIWFEAFTYLRFGIATSMAWVMGIALIGFTLYQLRILRKVEFRRAENF
ncbi:MAG: extracellular solute-binding protein [Planctomycetota bacterium]